MVQLYSYKAGTGDFLRVCFWSEKDNIHHNVFIDGGKKPKVIEKRLMTFQKVVESLAKSSTDIIDAIFVTHWDDDHIEGVVDCFEKTEESVVEKIDGLYMNSGIIGEKEKSMADRYHSPKKAKTLVEFITDKNINWIDSISQEAQAEN